MEVVAGATDERVVAAAEGDTLFIGLLFDVVGKGGEVLALAVEEKEVLVGWVLL